MWHQEVEVPMTQPRRSMNSSSERTVSRGKAAAAATLSELGARFQGLDLGGYLSRFVEADVQSLRATKDTLSERLRASRDQPQIVTVRGMKGETDAEYFLVPVERMADMLEEVAETMETAKPTFVPITAQLRALTGGEALPSIDRSAARAPKVPVRSRALPPLSAEDTV